MPLASSKVRFQHHVADGFGQRRRQPQAAFTQISGSDQAWLSALPIVRIDHCTKLNLR